jgi:hypothetical protein
VFECTVYGTQECKTSAGHRAGLTCMLSSSHCCSHSASYCRDSLSALAYFLSSCRLELAMITELSVHSFLTGCSGCPHMHVTFPTPRLFHELASKCWDIPQQQMFLVPTRHERNSCILLHRKMSDVTGFHCSTSQKAFANKEALAEHYRSDLHRYNLKRKVAGAHLVWPASL